MRQKILFLLLFFYGLSGCNQQSKDIDSIRRELKEIRGGQERIARDIHSIKRFLRIPEEFKEAIIDIADEPFKGSNNAKVTLVEFSDYQCPFCAQHIRETMPEIEREFINTGKLKYILKDFPLQTIHPLAFNAHVSANCAGEQGRYWQMHDKIFSNIRAIDMGSLNGYAKELGLDMNKFNSCLNDGKQADEVRKDIKEGLNAGVDSTPTFLLGLTDPQDQTKVKVSVMIKGAYPYQRFKEAIEGLLSKVE